MEENIDNPLQGKNLRSRVALNKFKNLLIGQPDVNAIGIGRRRVKGKETGEICLKAFVPQKLPEKILPAWRILPKSLPVDGHKVMVDVEEMEKAIVPNFNISAMQTTISSKEASPLLPVPMQPGQSSANIISDVGTVCIYARRKGQIGTHRRFFISCNHVFSSLNLAPIGTPIIAPARLDGGIYPYNQIGNLINFIPLWFGPLYNNFCDAALAYTLQEKGGINKVKDIGIIKELGSIQSLEDNPVVYKTGRTTGVTSGTVVAASASIKVDYWALGSYGVNTVFHNQIITTHMGAYGDSGSLLINHQQRAVGMLFAGSATHTFFNPLHLILQAFELEI
ncbi:hypothetical protein [Chitinophaga pinensis]|uniref:Uncharacterized protein n=1 Tax=Chitinophaga pinensis TaxID=79329 RepID=A0A5C6LQT6_9BACT|nr:hypothetical protein [Chitinophaga pinensis]TWV98859.1 hypothetical protein FEF09_19660 [Chitinophaga pinensis]